MLFRSVPGISSSLDFPVAVSHVNRMLSFPVSPSILRQPGEAKEGLPHALPCNSAQAKTALAFGGWISSTMTLYFRSPK